MDSRERGLLWVVEADGDRYVTALQAMVEFWAKESDSDNETRKALAVEQYRFWSAIRDRFVAAWEAE